MLEGTYTPPLYLDLYNFHDGAQHDIYENTTDTHPSSTLPASASGPVNNMAATLTSSSLPSKKEFQTSSPSPHSSEPAAHSPSSSHGSTPAGASHTQTDAAKPTSPKSTAAGHAGGDWHKHHKHHHHHEHSGQCSCHEEGSHQ
jgi:hypothetical protein